MKLEFCFIVLSLVSISFAEGASRNLCDDLVDSGTSSKIEIDKCLNDPRFGPSEHYKAAEAKNKKKEDVEKLKTVEATSLNNNLEIKNFSSAELSDAGFGKAFYAIRGDYRNNRYKEKRLTEGDALCTYLGYEKAIKSIVSPELYESKNGEKVDKQGLVLDTNIFGMVSKTPEIYRDEDYKFTVRKYVEIACVRRKDKSLDGSKDALKVVTEDLITLNGELNSKASDNKNSGVNNGARSASEKEGKTPFGYTAPEWAKAQPK
jgi:hypothetical protein